MSVKRQIKELLYRENIGRLLSLFCLIFGIISIATSFTFFIAYLPLINSPTAFGISFLILFVGIWAPTLIGIANYFKK